MPTAPRYVTLDADTGQPTNRLGTPDVLKAFARGDRWVESGFGADFIVVDRDDRAVPRPRNPQDEEKAS